MIRWSPDEKSLIETITPGGIILASILVVVSNEMDKDSRNWCYNTAIQWAESNSSIWIPISLLSALASLFFGTLLSVFVGYVEAKVYDRITRCRLGLTGDVYYRQWDQYIHSLDDDKRNSYISQVFTNFRREVKLGIALMVLAFSLTGVSAPFYVVFSLFALAGWLLYTAHHDHHILGEYRQQRAEGVQQTSSVCNCSCMMDKKHPGDDSTGSGSSAQPIAE